jgi:opacity protein-like surface antigen
MRLLGSLLFFVAMPCCFAQDWEVGVAGGYSTYQDTTIKNGSGESAQAGFGSRFAVGAVLTENVAEHIGGELRYTYLDGDSELGSGGREVNLAARSQAIHYDFLFYATPRRARLRPFAAVGAGIKRYDGTGVVSAAQPLSDFAVLSHGHQVVALLSFGAGLKVSLSDHWVLRLDFRDYATPFPDRLFVQPRSANQGGWLQNFVPMAGVDWTFGGR